MSVKQRPTFKLLNHMNNLKKKMPLDATPTNYVQFDESNNNMVDKKKFLRWERQLRY
jgi:hypothetical protein